MKGREGYGKTLEAEKTACKKPCGEQGHGTLKEREEDYEGAKAASARQCMREEAERLVEISMRGFKRVGRGLRWWRSG